MGPYATPNILSAMAVAERHGYMLPQHTAVHRAAADLRLPVPRLVDRPDAERVRPEPAVSTPSRRLPEPPETIARRPTRTARPTSSPTACRRRERSGRAHDRRGARPRGRRGHPVPAGHDRLGADRHPDPRRESRPVVTNALGVDTVGLIEAMEQLDYQPPLMFSLFPAPGPLLGRRRAVGGRAVGLDLRAQRRRSSTSAGPEVQPRSSRSFDAASRGRGPAVHRSSRRRRPRRGTPGRSSPRASRRAGSSTSRPSATRCTRTAPTRRSAGTSTFDPAVNNFWPTTPGLKQIQDGDWVMVWPDERRCRRRSSGPAA